MDASLDSAPLLALILVADFAITSLHSYQELKGVGAPLWRNFGAIAGLDVPDRLGFLFFTVVLTLILFATGFVGITGLIGPCLTAAALGVLIGARLSDTIVSHVLLYTVGYRPNPGLTSTPLYVIEFSLYWMGFLGTFSSRAERCDCWCGRRRSDVRGGVACVALGAKGHAGLEAPPLVELATDSGLGVDESSAPIADRNA